MFTYGLLGGPVEAFSIEFIVWGRFFSQLVRIKSIGPRWRKRRKPQAFIKNPHCALIRTGDNCGGKFKQTETDSMAEWRELCIHEDVEKLILAHLRSDDLSSRMLAGVQRELVSRTGAGVGRVGEVAMEFIRRTGSYIASHCA